MSRRKPTEYASNAFKDRKFDIRNEPRHLRGPSHNKHGGKQATRMKHYGDLGPASEGRSLSAEEIARIEADMRERGEL